MDFIPEKELVKLTDQPTQEILKLWHALNLDLFGKDIEVVAADRRLNEELRNIEGFSTAFPYEVNGTLCLVLWLDSVKEWDSILITHELGHWVLNLQGFIVLIETNNPHGELVSNLNSLAQHPVLYILQRSIGHEPQPMIDTKTHQDTMCFDSQKEIDKKFWALDSLLAADDILNCSEHFKQPLEMVLSEKYPNTNRSVKMILDTTTFYDLNNPRENLRFCKRIKTNLKLPGNWTELDQCQQLRDELK